MSDYRWSRGPRIGDEGVPVCFDPAGHYPATSHRAHPDSGFTAHWGAPDMTIPENDRENWWTPDMVKLKDYVKDSPMTDMINPIADPGSDPPSDWRPAPPRCLDRLEAKVPDTAGYTRSVLVVQCERPSGHRGVHKVSSEITWSAA